MHKCRSLASGNGSEIHSIAGTDAVLMQRLGTLCVSRAWRAGLGRPALSPLSLRCAASRASSAEGPYVRDTVNKVRPVGATALLPPPAATAASLPATPRPRVRTAMIPHACVGQAAAGGCRVLEPGAGQRGQAHSDGAAQEHRCAPGEAWVAPALVGAGLFAGAPPLQQADVSLPPRKVCAAAEGITGSLSTGCRCWA